MRPQALGVKEEMPTLINLNEDMTGEENLIYFLMPGTTIIGSDEPGEDSQEIHFIKLGGVDEYRHKPVLQARRGAPPPSLAHASAVRNECTPLPR